jgi:hypothetical protein
LIGICFELVRFAEKPWLKILFADLLREKILFQLKNKLKNIDYKTSKQDLCYFVSLPRHLRKKLVRFTSPSLLYLYWVVVAAATLEGTSINDSTSGHPIAPHCHHRSTSKISFSASKQAD